MTTGERPSSIPWPPLLLVGSLAAGLLLGAALPLPWPGADDHLTTVAGLALIGVGLAFIGWAAAALRRHATTIRPDKGSDALVTDGPYTSRRNPIYLGDAILLLGAGVLVRNLWLIGLAPVFMMLVTWLAILPEERYLTQRFGAAYREYLARTRRWL